MRELICMAAATARTNMHGRGHCANALSRARPTLTAGDATIFLIAQHKLYLFGGPTSASPTAVSVARI